MLFGLACAGALLTAAWRRHGLAIPFHPAWIALAVFLLLGTASAALSPSPWRSIAGGSNARAGFALYACCALLCLAAATLARGGGVHRTVRGLLVCALPVIAYGAVQVVGLDPLTWRARFGGPLVFSTFGNGNFMSGWLGVITVLAVWGATGAGWSRRWRWLATAVAVGGPVVSWASGSIQGPIAAVAGCAVLGAVRLTDRGRHRARPRAVRAVVAVAIPLAVIATGLALLGARGNADRSFETRTGKWQAALAIGADRPVTGVGFDLFSDWYHAYRPLSDAATRGVNHTADAAHSVPLQLLAGGGVPLAIAYLSFVGLVIATTVVATRRAHGERRLRLGALSGAGVAYLIQSFVSMDVPPLAVLGWVLAGFLLATAAPAHAPRFDRCTHRRWSQLAALVVTLLAGAAVLAFAVPLRADMAARRATALASQQRHVEAERALAVALDLNPWDPAYPLQLARLRHARGDDAQALQAYRVATVRQPRGILQALETPRAAAAVKDHAAALAGYDYALTLDPSSPDLLVEAARYHLKWGSRERAFELLERAVTIGGRHGARAERILGRQR